MAKSNAAPQSDEPVEKDHKYTPCPPGCAFRGAAHANHHLEQPPTKDKFMYDVHCRQCGAALSPAESPDLADTPDAQPELEDKIEEILNFYHQEMNRTVPAEHLQGRHSVTIGLAKGHLLSLLKQERKSAKREVLEELMVDPWIEPRSQSKNIAYERLERELANLDEDE